MKRFPEVQGVKTGLWGVCCRCSVPLCRDCRMACLDFAKALMISGVYGDSF